MQVHANGRRLWFDVDGPALVPDGPTMRERPTVVLLHGGPGSYDHSYLKPDFARLADVAQVVYLDLPGHGRSEWGDATTWSLELCPTLVVRRRARPDYAHLRCGRDRRGDAGGRRAARNRRGSGALSLERRSGPLLAPPHRI